MGLLHIFNKIIYWFQ